MAVGCFNPFAIGVRVMVGGNSFAGVGGVLSLLQATDEKLSTRIQTATSLIECFRKLSMLPPPLVHLISSKR
ncbi:hypothetical protein GPEL0_01r2232 [Geoanaerobacter pelophilus]|uniref:Uncharacterized protein n=1 Tax=Geoanaerobacter pelophilus TaxID=60036 RepID=A0ABQ0MI33_9BACT|nr:hypothetical protein GPEL0_01r2232 [Geoanaerobacter pelophilus]